MISRATSGDGRSAAAMASTGVGGRTVTAMSESAGEHPNVRVVVEAAARQGVALEVHEFPAGTRTAQDAAAAVGVDVGQIVKSLVFRVDGRPVLALVSGDNQVDESRLAEAVGGGEVVRADADLVRAATGLPIGGVPPFGHHAELETVLDRDLLDHEVVWAAAGTPRHVFPISPPALQQLSRAKPAAVAVEPPEAPEPAR
jgi:prolyl-tRNA editing enzyme YbaK/EbsC (Cys-tRNA(Pro) deacylase)